MRNPFGFTSSAFGVLVSDSRSAADTPIIVRAMGSRALLGALPSLNPGMIPALANGF
jgi:hypothetical protein